MSNHAPDKWVLLEIHQLSDNYIYRVILGSWYGGYTTGDSWRLSSGNEKAFPSGDNWVVKQKSGSSYVCHKDSYGMSYYTESVLERLIKENEKHAIIKVLPKPETETEFLC
jgi:hypothetical protein